MAKLLVTGQVQDPEQWEKSFKTYGALFKRLGINSPISFGIGENNHVAVLEDVDDVQAVLASLNSPEVVESMEATGAKRDTVKVFVLDKEYSF